MENQNSNNGMCRLIADQKRTVEVSEQTVQYDLYKLSGDGWEHGYLIGVRGFDDAQLVFVGVDESAAREIFSAVISGGVTACTLAEVAADILESRADA